MFTGIVTDIGTVTDILELSEGKRLTVETVYDCDTIDIGASIAHEGVCLTVVEKAESSFQVEAWEEALRLTTIGSWTVGQRINLERALKVGDELGGHIVSGHVDAMARVCAVKEEGDATRFTIETTQGLARFVAPKGSVTLNGTSLTVNQVDGCQFDVLLIKHSQEVTTWGNILVDDWVNIEIDTMARYAARLADFPIIAK